MLFFRQYQAKRITATWRILYGQRTVLQVVQFRGHRQPQSIMMGAVFDSCRAFIFRSLPVEIGKHRLFCIVRYAGAVVDYPKPNLVMLEVYPQRNSATRRGVGVRIVQQDGQNLL